MSRFRAIARLSLFLLLTSAYVLAAQAQQRSADKQRPEFKSAHLVAWLGPVARTADGRRINVPIEIKSTHPTQNLYLAIANVTKAGATDETGARCGFSRAHVSVAGLIAGVERREDAAVLTPGSNMIVILSLQCEPEAKGQAFAVSAELILYVGNEKQLSRLVVGAHSVPVVGKASN